MKFDWLIEFPLKIRWTLFFCPFFKNDVELMKERGKKEPTGSRRKAAARASRSMTAAAWMSRTKVRISPAVELRRRESARGAGR